MVAFPSWLEDRLIIDGLSITEESNRISSLGDVGEPIERLQSTRSGATYTARFHVSRNEMQLFRDWWQVDAKYGIVPVEWKDPFSLETLSFLITEPPVYTPAGAGINVDLELYLFPGYSPPEIVDVTGALASDIPLLSMSGAGSVAVQATAHGAIELPMLVLTAGGLAIAEAEGVGALELPQFILHAEESEYTGGKAFMELPALVLTGTGSEERLGLGDLDLPALEVTAGGEVNAVTPRVYLQDVISSLGLTTGQVFCLDAGDGDSYGGSGQVWEDLSAAGQDWNRGSGTGSDAADPTWNGSANGGTAAEYFSFDGGDYFSAAGSPTFDDTWGRDGSIFTILGMIYLPSAGGSTKTYYPLSNRGSGFPDVGVSVRIQQVISTTISTTLDLAVNNGALQNTLGTVTIGLVENGWVFFAISYNENGGANASHSRLQATTVSYNGNNVVPPVTSPFNPPKIGALGNGGSPMPAGTRIGCIAAWSTALTASNIADIYTALKERYTSLP